MFKTNNETILIDAKATDPIPTGVVFWSHDRGTAKLIFQLQKDYMNQPLSAGTIVPILLEFNSDTAEGGRGRHIYHAVIEDAINGIVSIVLEDNILGYVGRVTGSIYIELPDSRSLDTAGRFTFDIKRSPIDLNTPELEDYYWQGFNEIIDEYHQTINTIESEAKALIDSLTADVTTAQSKITQLEQSITTANTNLNARIDEINKKIDDNDVFTKAESSANVIDQIGGAETAILKKELLVDGTEGTGARDDNGTLVPFVESDYIDLNDPDKFVRSESLINGRGAEIEFEFPVISTLEKKYPYLFEGLKTMAEKKSKYLSMVKSVGLSQFSRGGGIRTNGSDGKNHVRPYIKKLTNGFLTLSSWANTTNNFVHFNDTWDESRMSLIQNNGSYIVFVCSKKNDSSDGGAISDGITTAWVEVKDIRLVIELEANGRTVIESFIAANRVENLATQEEAETGEDNKKIMTPLRVMQSIKKFVENKFVSIAGNETIGGLKNFRDGLLVNDVSVLTARTASQRFDSSTSGEIQAGSIKFDRVGPYVFVDLNFQVRADQDITQDQNIFYGLKNELMCDTEYMDFIISYSGVTALINVLQTKMTARTTLVKSTWYVGKTFYKAKN